MGQPLQLYLIRHGIAVDRSLNLPDEQRPLTEKGIQRTQQVAHRLRSLGITFDYLQTSPLVRACQTAEILQRTALVGEVHVSEWLSPQGSFDEWLAWLQSWRQQGHSSLAIVGHEPYLSEWAERLIWGTVRHQLVLKKAGMIGILLPEEENPVSHSTLFWLTAPKFLL
jgi:phosphohistidine phosphatase